MNPIILRHEGYWVDLVIYYLLHVHIFIIRFLFEVIHLINIIRIISTNLNQYSVHS